MRAVWLRALCRQRVSPSPRPDMPHPQPGKVAGRPPGRPPCGALCPLRLSPAARSQPSRAPQQTRPAHLAVAASQPDAAAVWRPPPGRPARWPRALAYLGADAPGPLPRARPGARRCPSRPGHTLGLHAPTCLVPRACPGDRVSRQVPCGPLQQQRDLEVGRAHDPSCLRARLSTLHCVAL